MRQTREKRPHGRKMPHPDEARNSDGTMDLAAASKQMDEVKASFAAGEYALVDVDESAIAGTDLEQVLITRRKLKK